MTVLSISHSKSSTPISTPSSAADRVKALFGAQFANVQPHSGAQANASVMHALLTPGDTILGLSLAHGGHLTHGMRLNFSGKLYNVAAYGVSEADHRIHLADVARAARKHRPKLIIAGWSAYPGTSTSPLFATSPTR